MKETALLLLVVLSLIITVSSSSVDGESNGGVGQWQILTKQNFSSQIRLHPHLLILVSVPWSGEARSLMREISQLVTQQQDDSSSLKLFFLQRNKEKLLADTIGAASTDEVTVLYFHNSVSYKYQGKLRGKNVISSILPYVSSAEEDIVPLKVLRSEEELKWFVESTDKALLVLEFCGWTQRLLDAAKSNKTEHAFGMQEDLSEMGVTQEANRIATPKGKENKKGMENVKLECGIENGLSGIPWLGGLSSVNDSIAFQEVDPLDTENVNANVGSHCTFKEFQQFDSFFSRFITTAREFFLSPEKHKFGLVLERSLLSSLGIGDTGSWSVMLYIRGCPSHSKILKEGDDLRSILQMDDSIVTEIKGDGQDIYPPVPANKPSVLLFVDRSSDSLGSRRKGKEAIDALRELALHYQISDLMGQQKNGKLGRSSIQALEHFSRISGHPKLNLAPMAQNIKLKDKMSIMIVNEGKHIILDNMASDLQGSSLHEILVNLVQHKKEAKLSSVAKELGFQLLSGDFDIKLADTLASAGKVESNEVSPVPSEEGLVKESIDRENGFTSSDDERSQTSDIRPSQDNKEKAFYVDTDQQLLHVKPDDQMQGQDLAISEDAEAEEKNSSQVDKMGDEQVHFQSFKGSFFFSEGNYRLLKALTGETRIPSLVIIDPILQQHYVFPQQTLFSYASLENFLHGFLNGSLIPYQRSESGPGSHRKSTRPPFVNLDFHEADSIPRITAHTFSEQVLGFNQSENDKAVNALNEDVLVLFTNNWCGFCQRMELIVREVYRAIKGYSNMLKIGSNDGKTAFRGDNLKNAILKLPKIFLMDCTLNDCSLILKSTDQREVYPTLLLFPAERKTAVPYEGNMAIADVIKFIANRGRNSQHLTSEKGIISTVAEKTDRNQNLYKDKNHEATPVAKDKSHEVLLKNRMPKKVVEHSWVKSHTPKGLPEKAHVPLGSILVATEKLNVQPFDKSAILIVKADQDAGFQGLIYNKPISWDSLNELDEGLELLKEAPLSLGGPLIKRGMPLVALTRRVVKDQNPEVVPGIYFLNELDTLREIEELKAGNQSIADYWFFLGFSSWGWDQLFNEIAAGAWNLSENSRDHPLEWPSS